MQKIRTFKDLIVWQEGHMLVLMVYKVTKKFPKEELFGLTNQLRRAVVSFTSNIAEGFSRNSYKEKLQFYSMSLGSLTEVDNQLTIAKDVDYLTEKEYAAFEEQITIVSRLCNGIIKSSKAIILNS